VFPRLVAETAPEKMIAPKRIKTKKIIVLLKLIEPSVFFKFNLPWLTMLPNPLTS